MTKQREITLSPNWIRTFQKIGNILLSIGIALNSWVIILKTVETEINVIAGAIITLSVLIFIARQFIHISVAKITDNKIVLKRQFKPVEQHSFNKISAINSFNIGTIKYIKLDITESNKKLEYIIISRRNISELEDIDVVQLLKSMQESEI
ncbi:MAG: hypothetical protein N4A72_16925 [Bacteroidales bacterium]|nr:hypothetical protein [Bacteroidales bacterium]